MPAAGAACRRERPRQPARPPRPGGPAGGWRSPCWRSSSPAAPSATPLIEGWSLWDAFYMTVIYGHDGRVPGSPPAVARRARSSRSSLVMGGVATVLYTFSFFMARVVEGDLQERWIRRRRQRMLDDLDEPLHHLRLRPHRADHRPRVRAAGGALRRHRARPRAHAGGDRPPATSPSRRTRAAKRCCSGSASSGRAGSSPRSAPTPRTSTRC